MKPVLVHIHAFYPELLPEILERLNSLKSTPIELVVSTVAAHAARIRLMLEEIDYARIVVVENRGYDIAPFLEVLKDAEPARYSYIIKLHTKRDIPGDAYMKPYPYNYGEWRWREYLLNFCKPENFRRTIKAFEQQKHLGMVADYRVLCRKEESRFLSPLNTLLTRLGLQMRGYSYVMGSMFICRSILMTPLKRLGLNRKDFPVADAAHSENMAHVVERLLGLVVLAQGYSIEDAFTPVLKQSQWLCLMHRLARFLYYRKRGRDGSLIIKICKIPVFYKRCQAETK